MFVENLEAINATTVRATFDDASTVDVTVSYANRQFTVSSEGLTAPQEAAIRAWVDEFGPP